MGEIPLRIWFNKVDGFVKVFVWTRYLVLFALKIFDAIYDKIRYLISIDHIVLTNTILHTALIMFSQESILII